MCILNLCDFVISEWYCSSLPTVYAPGLFVCPIRNYVDWLVLQPLHRTQCAIVWCEFELLLNLYLLIGIVSPPIPLFLPRLLPHPHVFAQLRRGASGGSCYPCACCTHSVSACLFSPSVTSFTCILLLSLCLSYAQYCCMFFLFVLLFLLCMITSLSPLMLIQSW